MEKRECERLSVNRRNIKCKRVGEGMRKRKSGKRESEIWKRKEYRERWEKKKIDGRDMEEKRGLKKFRAEKKKMRKRLRKAGGGI